MASFKAFWVLCLSLAGILFALTGTSKASIYLTVNGEDRDWVELLPSEVCNIEIVSTDNSVYGALIGFDEGTNPHGAFVHTETRPEAGTDASVETWNEWPLSYGYYVTAIDFSIPPNVQPGVHFVFQYHAEDFGQVMLGLWDDYLNLADSIQIIVMPPWYGACCCGPGCCYMSDGSDCWDEWLGPGTDCSMCEAPLTVISPNGYEKLVGGEIYRITWLARSLSE